MTWKGREAAIARAEKAEAERDELRAIIDAESVGSADLDEWEAVVAERDALAGHVAALREALATQQARVAAVSQERDDLARVVGCLLDADDPDVRAIAETAEAAAEGHDRRVRADALREAAETITVEGVGLLGGATMADHKIVFGPWTDRGISRRRSIGPGYTYKAGVWRSQWGGWRGEQRKLGLSISGYATRAEAKDALDAAIIAAGGEVRDD